MFARVLIANRGEIACRVARTCRRMGVRSIAVYSEADANAMHVAIADDAVAIGPAPARESYLAIDKIIAAAKRAGAQAVHPGYGFLSENADFAQACADNDLVFIGPPVSAIRAMGSKSESKRLMAEAGVPLVPGYHGDDQSDSALATAAANIGFPVLAKASAGGGGKGMRVIAEAASLSGALEGARREALAAFGDDRLLIERYLERPRHVEVQVFADRHGNVIHLHDRDCSTQRRHQKVVEEAPAPGLAPEIRRAMGDAAIKAALAVGYVGAGTIEFLVGDGRFYFIEMNTRLQVEHPVTEMITGLDLVEWQLRIAVGEVLPLKQRDVPAHGHAMEARLYAEDPERGFLPASGAIAQLRWPVLGDGERIDTGVREGDAIGAHYDPMIAKLIAWGVDRQTAARRLAGMLAGTVLAGTATNASFLYRLLGHPAFVKAEIDTGFIERWKHDLIVENAKIPQRILALGAAATILNQTIAAREKAMLGQDPHSPWLSGDGWRLNGTGGASVVLRLAESQLDARVSFAGRVWSVVIDAGEATELVEPQLRDAEFQATIGGKLHRIHVVQVGLKLTIIEDGIHWRLEIEDVISAAEAVVSGHARIVSPMPGTIVRLLVGEGTNISRGSALIVVEAMKMEHAVVAPADGRVGRIHYRAGETVAEGAELMEFEADK
jgi:3-methylcrotonyl-CoA carboxylase alpha subunit